MRPKFLIEITKRQEQIHFVKVFLGLLCIMYGVLGIVYYVVHL